jgi:hypothetical protein
MQQSNRGYQGLACQCVKCQSLTPEKRQAKHERITAGRRQGGRTRAAQPSMQEARRTAFWRTMETHPFYARKWLKKRIQEQNRARVDVQGA